MALNNLRGEFVKRGVTQTAVAEYLDMTLSNFSKKLSEAIPTTVDEAKKIRDRFCPGMSLDYLLTSDGDVPSEKERMHAQVETFREAMGGGQLDAKDEQTLAEMHAAVDEYADERK